MKAYVVILGVALIKLVLKALDMVRGMAIRAMSWPIVTIILGTMIGFVLGQAIVLWSTYQ
jgi:hypothetical protein